MCRCKNNIYDNTAKVGLGFPLLTQMFTKDTKGTNNAACFAHPRLTIKYSNAVAPMGYLPHNNFAYFCAFGLQLISICKVLLRSTVCDRSRFNGFFEITNENAEKSSPMVYGDCPVARFAKSLMIREATRRSLNEGAGIVQNEAVLSAVLNSGSGAVRGAELTVRRPIEDETLLCSHSSPHST